MPKVAKAGLDRGKIILQKIPNSEQPSILAASDKSLGIDLKNCLNKNTPKTCPAPGMIKPQ
ncbi:unnamed protein product [marine sediment metagenome]|uniref:Uncharacterized protein n=1 Tax=marine sediment metagenome TaxID=412755 RepID=X1DKR9_9ZZZZ